MSNPDEDIPPSDMVAPAPEPASAPKIDSLDIEQLRLMLKTRAPSLDIIYEKDRDNKPTIRIKKIGYMIRFKSFFTCDRPEKLCASDQFVKCCEFCAQWCLYILLGYIAFETMQYRGDTEDARLATTSFDCACVMPCDAVGNATDDSMNARLATNTTNGTGTCADSAMLDSIPEDTYLTVAAVIFGVCKFLQGATVGAVVGLKNSCRVLNHLHTLHGQIHGIHGVPEAYSPHTKIFAADRGRILEGFLGLGVLAVMGTYLSTDAEMKKDSKAAGPLAVMFGAIIFNNACS